MYYCKIAPVYNAIQMIAKEFSMINSEILDIAKNQYYPLEQRDIPLSAALDVLHNPNQNETRSTFFEQLAIDFHAVGEAFIYATALDEDSPILELYKLDPLYMMVGMGDNDGYPLFYQFNGVYYTLKFNKRITDGRVRYITDDGTKELLHLKNYNPFSTRSSGSVNFTGLSPLQPLYLEIEQYLHANVHNLSTLKNGARPAAALLLEENLTDEQFISLQTQIRNFYQGAINSGNVVILEGLSNGSKEFKELSITNKDMDFAVLRRENRQMMYRLLNIPLPMVETESQKYSNFAESRAVLIHMAVLPFATKIFNALSKFLQPRYAGEEKEKYIISYNAERIVALGVVYTAEAKEKISTGAFTLNEGRHLFGLPPIDGGDTLYTPLNMIPIDMPPEDVMNIRTSGSKQPSEKNPNNNPTN